jgi:hypothetical protein
MITTTLLAVLGLLLAVVLWQMFKSGAAKKHVTGGVEPTPIAGPGTAVDLPAARIGDVISVHGAAADFSDVDFTVDRRSAYQSGPNKWIDLSGEFRGERVYLEVYPGREAEIIGMFDPRRFTIGDVGVTEEQLAGLDARQDPSQFLTFEGKRWHYVSSREIGYFENETGAGEGLYRWLFRESGGDRLLCIEKWEGEPFDVRFARRINRQDITIYRAA